MSTNVFCTNKESWVGIAQFNHSYIGWWNNIRPPRCMRLNQLGRCQKSLFSCVKNTKVHPFISDPNFLFIWRIPNKIRDGAPKFSQPCIHGSTKIDKSSLCSVEPEAWRHQEWYHACFQHPPGTPRPCRCSCQYAINEELLLLILQVLFWKFQSFICPKISTNCKNARNKCYRTRCL